MVILETEREKAHSTEKKREEYEARNRQKRIALAASQPLVLKKGRLFREPLLPHEFAEHIEGLLAIVNAHFLNGKQKECTPKYITTRPPSAGGNRVEYGDPKSLLDELTPDTHYNLTALVQGDGFEIHAHTLPKRSTHLLAAGIHNAALIIEGLGALGAGYLLGEKGVQSGSVELIGAAGLVAGLGLTDVIRRIAAEYTHGMGVFFHSTLASPTAGDGTRYYMARNKVIDYCKEHS